MEKTSDADLVREMLGFAAERLMEPDVGSKTGAAWGEKNPDRLAQRNGYRDRVWETRAGTIELRKLQVPELRRAMGFPKSFRLDRGTRRVRSKLLGMPSVHPSWKPS